MLDSDDEKFIAQEDNLNSENPEDPLTTLRYHSYTDNPESPAPAPYRDDPNKIEEQELYSDRTGFVYTTTY